jgi:hypothetical protein
MKIGKSRRGKNAERSERREEKNVYKGVVGILLIGAGWSY